MQNICGRGFDFYGARVAIYGAYVVLLCYLHGTNMALIRRLLSVCFTEALFEDLNV